MTKQFALNVLLYLLVSILLIYSGIGYWRDGNKGIGILSIFVAALSIWQAVENAKDENVTRTL